MIGLFLQCLEDLQEVQSTRQPPEIAVVPRIHIFEVRKVALSYFLFSSLQGLILIRSSDSVASDDLTSTIAIPNFDTTRSGSNVVSNSNLGEGTDGASLVFWDKRGGACVPADH